MARKVAHLIGKGGVSLPFITRRILAASAFLAASMAVHAQASKPVPEQTRFSKKIQLERPAAIPGNVLRLLLSSKEGKEGMARATSAQKQTPAQMFRASEIHLHAADETDLQIQRQKVHVQESGQPQEALSVGRWALTIGHGPCTNLIGS
jgi:hypothetical protein